MRRRVWSRLLLTTAVLASGLAFLQVATSPADAESFAFSKTVTATRVLHDEDGSIDAAAGTSDKVTVKVSQVSSLRGRQEIDVVWSGAHPTGGVVADATSEAAKDQEYPVVVLQCRGIDTTGTVAKGQTRLSPQSCWTQSPSERYFPSSSQLPVWRADADATAAERAPVVGAPDPLPSQCDKLSEPVTARWLPLKAADGSTYLGGPDPGEGCIKSAPEASDESDVGLPSNTTYGTTKADGTGRAEFPVWTRAENATIGCSATVKCSLVVVPVVGLSCDAWGTQIDEPLLQANGNPVSSTAKSTANASCRKTGSYGAGEPRDSTRSSDAAVRGSYWWSASNWRNRVTVPLSFAATGDACDAVGSQADLDIGGSVVMNELTASWRPAFCAAASLFPFSHVQQADFFALDQVDSGTLPAAFASAPKDGGFSKPVVPAPVTVGGFAIAFSIDDDSKNRDEKLNLNARLVAKLLTQSYPATTWLREARPDLADNPLNISQDPEFVALNPGLRSSASLSAGATLQLMSDRADLIDALSSWVDADPEARAWIDGAADPWGTKVNPAFKGERLAGLDSFLRDEYEAPDWYRAANKCYGNSPSPFLNLVANPQPSLGAVTVNLQYATSAVLTECFYQTEDPVASLALKKEGRQPVGQRFVLGLVTLSAAQRYNLRTASLQTTSSVPATQKFTSAAGRTFVKGDDAGLKAATALLDVDDESRTWGLDYARLSKAAGAKAYPGALPVYAAVPTKGLDTATATRLAKFLCYAVDPSRGLVEGRSNGRLPAGYLPLSDANGLSAQRDYTLQAVSAIRNQSASVPALDAKKLSYDAVCDFKAAAAPVATPSSGSSSSGGPGVSDVSDLPAGDVPADDTADKASDGAATSQTTDLALTAGEQSALGNVGVPLLLLLALLAGLAGSALRWAEPLAAAAREARGRVDLGGRHRRP